MTVAAAADDAPRLGLGVKLLYGVGASATNLKARALSTLLVLFYNQVVGLPPQSVGLVLTIALFLDAFLDPVMGQISDNFRSRWGRRHPFMLAAAVPYALAFFLLFHPPRGWSEEALLVYLTVCLLSVRVFDTLFEVPHQALAPELARDYDGRTNLLAMRQFFAVAGGLGMQVLALHVLLKENPDGSGGVLDRDGYFAYAVTGASIIFVTVVLSTLGTASRIPYLEPAPSRKITVPAMLREVAQTLNNRAFIVGVLTMIFIAVAVGARNGLELYFGLYFWGLSQAQLAVLATITTIGGFLGVLLAPAVSRVLGKKHGCIAVFATAVVIHTIPISLRLLDLAPPNGSPALLWLIYGEEIINATLASATAVLLAAVLADVVEDAEVKTGRRSEGLLLAANSLFRKAISGMGIFTATTILAVAGFPENAQRGQVPEEVLRHLGMAYLPVVVVLYGIAIGLLFIYDIDRARHEKNLETIRARKAAG